MAPSRDTTKNWEYFKDVIYDLYIRQDMTLTKLMNVMREEHKFEATKSMYETQIKEKWGFRKYLSVRGVERLRALAVEYATVKQTGGKRKSAPALLYNNTLTRPINSRTFRRRGVLPAHLEIHPQSYRDAAPPNLNPSGFRIAPSIQGKPACGLVAIILDFAEPYWPSIFTIRTVPPSTPSKTSLVTQFLNLESPISRLLPIGNRLPVINHGAQVAPYYRDIKSVELCFCLLSSGLVPLPHKEILLSAVHRSQGFLLVPDHFRVAALDPSARIILETCLRWALETRHWAFIETLHTHCVDLNQVLCNHDGIPLPLTAFEYACACGHLDLAAQLIDIGYTAQGRIDINPLVLSIVGWNERHIRQQKRKGCEDGDLSSHDSPTGQVCSHRGSRELLSFIQRMIDLGADKDMRGLIPRSLQSPTNTPIQRHTPITAAAAYHNAEVVKDLLARNVNLKDRPEEPAGPAQPGLSALAAWLLPVSSSWSRRFGDHTSHHSIDKSACEEVIVETATALLEAGADPNDWVASVYVNESKLEIVNILHLVATSPRLTDLLRRYGARPMIYPADFFQQEIGLATDSYFNLMIQGNVPISDELLSLVVTKLEEGDMCWLQKLISTVKDDDKLKFLTRITGFMSRGDIVEHLMSNYLPRSLSAFPIEAVAAFFETACPRLTVESLERINGGSLRVQKFPGTGSHKFNILTPGFRPGVLTGVAEAAFPQMSGRAIRASILRDNFAMAEYLSAELSEKINVVAAGGDTALNAAIRMRNAVLVQTLRDRRAEPVFWTEQCACGTDVHASALVAAAEIGDTEFLQAFGTQDQFSINAAGRLWNLDLLGKHQARFCRCVTPLTAAILGGNYSAVQLLFSRGARLTNARYVGDSVSVSLRPLSSLAAAIISTRLDMAKLLINKGANLADTDAINLIPTSETGLQFLQLFVGSLRAGWLHRDPEQRIGGLLLDSALRSFAHCDRDSARDVLQSILTSTIASVNGNYKLHGDPPSPMYRILSNGSLTLLPILIDAGADCNSLLWYKGAPQDGGSLKATSLLRMAVEQDCELRWIKFLIGVGAKDIPIPGLQNQTSLVQLATEKGNFTLKELLLDLNLDLDLRQTPSRTALQQAVLNGDLNTVGLLVQYGMKVNIEKLTTDEPRTPLEIAVESRNPRIVKYLVQHGSDVNERENMLLHAEDNVALNALQLAAKAGMLEIAGILLRNHANPNVVRLPAWNKPFGPGSDAFLTPLQLAVWHREHGMIELLLRYGAVVDMMRVDVSLSGNPSWELSYRRTCYTPLQLAVSQGNVDAVTILLHHNANPNAPAPHLSMGTALQCAATRGSLQITRLLLETGADVNALVQPLQDGRSALVEAAVNNRIDMVKLLVEFAPRTEAWCDELQKALDLARETDHDGKGPMVKCLTERLAEFLEPNPMEDWELFVDPSLCGYMDIHED
ncbi:hypothetical protein QBC43DRAFT_303841 [Cladorrhinum sp. PSN259]|nr:hypothetical protein QBC43DRAFT_303841 [Cladorrhinum sp. PSN259]